MAEPPRCRLRPARRNGHPNPRPRASNMDKPQDKRAAENYARIKAHNTKAKYYSRGFPACGRATARRDALCAGRCYIASPPSRPRLVTRFRLWRGAGRCSGASGRWPGAAVAGWTSAKARRAREISPAAYCLARPASRAVSAIDSLMGAMPGGQGWPPRTGTGASPRGISRSASVISPSSTVSLVSCPVPGSWMWPVSALRMAAARSWARAARAVWRQMPF